MNSAVFHKVGLTVATAAALGGCASLARLSARRATATPRAPRGKPEAIRTGSPFRAPPSTPASRPGSSAAPPAEAAEAAQDAPVCIVAVSRRLRYPGYHYPYDRAYGPWCFGSVGFVLGGHHHGSGHGANHSSGHYDGRH